MQFSSVARPGEEERLLPPGRMVWLRHELRIGLMTILLFLPAAVMVWRTGRLGRDETVTREAGSGVKLNNTAYLLSGTPIAAFACPADDGNDKLWRWQTAGMGPVVLSSARNLCVGVDPLGSASTGGVKAFVALVDCRVALQFVHDPRTGQLRARWGHARQGMLCLDVTSPDVANQGMRAVLTECDTSAASQTWTMHSQQLQTTIAPTQLPAVRLGTKATICLAPSLGLCGPDIFCLSNTLGSNMVLQRFQKAVIWGFSTPGDVVTVTLGGDDTDVQVATSTDTGFWQVSLDARPADHSPRRLVAQSRDTGRQEVLENVIFGDVFLCGGQSNMVMTVGQAFGADEEAAASERYPDIRLFSVGQGTGFPGTTEELSMLGTVDLPWQLPTKEALTAPEWSHFSAICWTFGRHLYDNLKVPIGLVSSNWGGTCIEHWMPDSLSDSCRSNSNAKLDKAGRVTAVDNEGVLFRAMIAPFLRMRLSGVLWYQGEANVGSETSHSCPLHGPYMYRCLLPTLINSWRRRFKVQNLFFGFVQLAPYTKYLPDLNNLTMLADIRDAQGYVARNSDARTVMVTAVDLGDPDSPWTDIHPRPKAPIGQRLARAALARVYNWSIVHEGPSFQSAIPAPNAVFDEETITIEVKFAPSSIGSGLELHSAACPQRDDPPGLFPKHCAGWEIQSQDGGWHTASVQVTNDTALVSAVVTSEFTLPVVAVRHLWGDWPVVSVFNKEGYPCLPFSAAIDS